MNMIELKKDGVFEVYKFKNYDKVDKKFKDIEDDVFWVGMSVLEIVIVVNYKEFKKLGIDILKSYEDLIKLEYKGFIIMLNLVLFGMGYFIVLGFI